MPIVYEHIDIQTNGVRLHTVQAGPEEGPVAVLLHGFPEFWYGWRCQIPALASAGYRVVVPDQRGYNLSDKPAGISAYRLHDLAADVVGLIHQLGHDAVFLVGHDWGGAVAWQVALEHPECVKKQVILNVPHPDVMLRFLSGSITQMRKSWYIFFFQLPWLPEALLQANNGRRLLGLLHGRRQDAFTEQDYPHYQESWAQRGAVTGMLNWYRAMIQRKRKKLADSRVHVPTRLIWGKHDPALGFEMAQPSIDLCDDGQLVMLDKASHWVQHDEPEKVNQLILAFFDKK